MTHPLLVLKELHNQIVEQSKVNYPPYNIKYVDEVTTALEIALAGISEDDIQILLDKNVLTVSYTKNDTSESKYFYKGISSKSFARTFTLSNDSVIKSAEMVNGLLSIYIRKVIPESSNPKKIPINTKSKPQLLTEGN